MADKLAREPDRPTFTRRVYNRLKSNADALRKRLQRDTIEGASIDPFTTSPAATAKAGSAPPCATGGSVSAGTHQGARPDRRPDG